MIEWLGSNKIGGKGARGYYLTVAVSKSGRDAKGVRSQNALCIRFSEQAAKDLRIIAGDRVIVGIDSVSKQVCFKRTSDLRGSYKISSNKSASKKVLSTQCLTDLPWHESVWIDKSRLHDEGGHMSVDVPEFFHETTAELKGGAA